MWFRHGAFAISQIFQREICCFSFERTLTREGNSKERGGNLREFEGLDLDCLLKMPALYCIEPFGYLYNSLNKGNPPKLQGYECDRDVNVKDI